VFRGFLHYALVLSASSMEGDRDFLENVVDAVVQIMGRSKCIQLGYFQAQGEYDSGAGSSSRTWPLACWGTTAIELGVGGR